MDDSILTKLKARLDDAFTWPCTYVFKFIAPQSESQALIAVFQGRPTSTRQSAKGNYISVTAELEMQNSDEVITIYREAAKIKDVIAL